MEDPQINTEEQERTELVDSMAQLGDRASRPDVIRLQIEEIYETLSKGLVEAKPHVFESIGLGLLHCGIQLPVKAPIYATLASLLTVTDASYANDLANKLVNALCNELSDSIREGAAGRARRAFRYLMCLATSSLVNPASAADYIIQFMEAAIFEFTEANRSTTGVHARGEFLADVVLSALPWIGLVLSKHVPEQLNKITQLFDTMKSTWITGRWRFVAPATSDRCVESFSELIDAIEHLRMTGWVCAPIIIVRPYELFEKELEQAKRLSLPTLSIPSHSKQIRYSAPRFRLFLVNDKPVDKDKRRNITKKERRGDENKGNGDSIEIDEVEDQDENNGQAVDATMNDLTKLPEQSEKSKDQNEEKKRVKREEDSADKEASDVPSRKKIKVENGEGSPKAVSADTANGKTEENAMNDTESAKGDVMTEKSDETSVVTRTPVIRSPLLNYILRSYVADVIENFSTQHVMAAERLLTMPMFNNVNDEIVEGVFSQLCAMPMSTFAPVYYGALFADLCLVKDSRLPQKLLTAVQTMFHKADQFDAETFDRLTDWFSFHLSNFGYRWNWADWAVYADNEMVEKFPFRALFCKDVLARCIRLSYYDRIAKLVPEEMKYFLPSSSVAGNKERFNSNVNIELMKIVTGKGRKEAPEVKQRLAELVPLQAEEGEPFDQEKAEYDAGFRRLASLMRAILDAGCKTLSHFDIVSERYLQLLQEMIMKGGTKSRLVVATEVSSFWRDVHIRKMYVLDKLATHGVIDHETIIRSCLSTEEFDLDHKPVALTPKQLKAKLSKSSLWEIVRLMMSRSRARENGARNELKIASQSAATAKEGDMENVESRLERAKQVTESAKKDVINLLQFVLKMLFDICAQLLETDDSEMLDENNCEQEGRPLPGMNGKPIWQWRCFGMIRELVRGHPRHLSTIVSFIDSETKELREKHEELRESFEILREAEGCSTLPQVL